MRIKKIAAILFFSMLMSISAYADTEPINFSDEELNTARLYYDVNTVSMSPETIAYSLRAKKYLNEHCSLPSDINNMTQEKYKQYLKSYVDTLLDFFQWNNDYSNFFEMIDDIDNHDRVMDVINNHIPNIYIFSNALTFCHDNNAPAFISFNMDSGTMGSNTSYSYYYTRFSSNDKNSPYLGSSMYAQKSYEGFLDIKRYAETRDDKYLCSEDFFPDIIGNAQKDREGNVRTLKEIREQLAAEDATGIPTKRALAWRNKEYVQIRVYAFYNSYLNCPQYFSGYTWYPDDSLNGDLKDSIVDMFGEDGYQKLNESASEAWNNKTIQDKELTIDLSAYYKH